MDAQTLSVFTDRRAVAYAALTGQNPAIEKATLANSLAAILVMLANRQMLEVLYTDTSDLLEGQNDQVRGAWAWLESLAARERWPRLGSMRQRASDRGGRVAWALKRLVERLLQMQEADQGRLPLHARAWACRYAGTIEGLRMAVDAVRAQDAEALKEALGGYLGVDTLGEAIASGTVGSEEPIAVAWLRHQEILRTKPRSTDHAWELLGELIFSSTECAAPRRRKKRPDGPALQE